MHPQNQVKILRTKAEQEFRRTVVLLIIILAFILSMIIIGMLIGPRYRLYRQDLQGQANLKQQEWEKQILVQQAKAELESAALKADAEVERAKGVARANEIIGDSLKGNEDYLRYLWITGLQEGESTERIYIPTEAGMPILEARPR